VVIRFPGGHLPMNEKSISPNKIKGGKELKLGCRSDLNRRF